MKSIQYTQGELFKGTRLRYIKELPRRNPKQRRALFQCTCGNRVETEIYMVRHHNIQSCGCLKKELVTEKNYKHGQATRNKFSGAYRSWQAMHQRVKVNPNYHNISICDRWRSFDTFFLDMGERPPDFTLERINNNGNYEPNNCIWANHHTQAQNTHNAKQITINNETHTISEWCRIKNISYSLIKQRRARGWSLIDAITTPPDPAKQNSIFSK